jgi:hypothetical protein
MATSDQMAVLGALSKAVGPVVLEEIAAMASISFERAGVVRQLGTLGIWINDTRRNWTLRPYCLDNRAIAHKEKAPRRGDGTGLLVTEVGRIRAARDSVATQTAHQRKEAALGARLSSYL